MDIFELIPKGKIWQGKNIKTLFLSLQDGILRSKKEANKLLFECIPNTSNALLIDWKRICNVQSLNGVMSTLQATGGNTEDFFLSLAKKFDSGCQILKNNPQKQFMTGIGTSGMSLGEQAIPKFCLVFHFSVENKIEESEKLLNKLKPAHVKFIYTNVK